MAIKKVSIDSFLKLATQMPVFDVRSPGEYNHAHIPGAFSLPLFTDDERKVVGTLYKQQGRQKAIKAGLDFFSPRMKQIVEAVEKTVLVYNSKNEQLPSIIIHCWRGGMRSAAVAWLLDLYGFDVYTLVGGYKSFRKWVLHQFEVDHDFRILGGYTGSGKTEVLKALTNDNHRVIDLEGLAHHKGSAFGGLGQPLQPTQEMFENNLASALILRNNEPCWIEDESQRIGAINIPHSLWNTIRNKPVYFIEIPFEYRLQYIVVNYGIYEKDKLVQAIIRIQKRLGGLETKNSIGFLIEGNITECFRILLNYYDKQYRKSLENRNNFEGLINKIDCSAVYIPEITQKILSCNSVL